MLGYAIRRIAFIVPTLFAIMVVNFLIVQAAPGGPVQQMIAKFKGNEVAATERLTGGASEIKSSSGRGRAAIAARAASTRPSSRNWRSNTASTSRRCSASLLMMQELSDLRFRQQLFPGPQRRRPDPRQAAGVDLDRVVDDADHLSRVDPARHPQGGARRQPLRHMDQRRHHHRLRDPELSVRGAADRAVRRRQLSGRFSRCAAWSATTGHRSTGRTASSTISGTSCCRSPRW